MPRSTEVANSPMREVQVEVAPSAGEMKSARQRNSLDDCCCEKKPKKKCGSKKKADVE